MVLMTGNLLIYVHRSCANVFFHVFYKIYGNVLLKHCKLIVIIFCQNVIKRKTVLHY